MTPNELSKEIDYFLTTLESFDEVPVIQEKLSAYFETYEDYLISAPYSISKDTSSFCYQGGWVRYMNRFVKSLKVMYKAWEASGVSLEFSLQELLITGYLCELGKFVADGVPVFVSNTVDWEVKKGIEYKLNPDLPFMDYADRSLYVCQQIGIELPSHFYLGIYLQNGLYEDDNKNYYVAYSPDKRLKSKIPHLINQAKIITSNL